MDKEAVANQLKALAQNSSTRSKASRLRDVVEHIESAMKAGVSRSAIVAILSKQGLEVSEKALSSNLYRIRKERDGGRKSSRAPLKNLVEITQSDNKENEDELENSTVTPSHNPADLDAIFNSKVDLDALVKAAKKQRLKNGN